MDTSRATTVESASRLVGRSAALATTGAALADAVAGAGGLMLVAGEPGIGKSAVLTEQTRLAVAAGVLVLRGVGWEGAGAPPYWLWTQVLRGLPGDVPGGPATPFDRAPIRSGAETAEARFRLFDTVRARFAAAGPLLVVLDDLQWADDESLRLLEFLRRGLAAERVLLLGAYRDGDAGPVLSGLAGSAPVVPLVGLDVAGVTALMAAVAGRLPDADLAAAVHRRCGGNPFFVRELTRLMVARGTWSVAGATGSRALPDGVRDTLRMRLARLSQACVGLLEVAAVAASDVAPVLLREVGPEDADTIAELLEEAGRARVLTMTDNGWRFSHDLYRETVLAQVSAARRAALHGAVGRALQVLSAGGTDPAAVGGAARLAAHFVAAGSATADDALRWSVRAAHEATARLGHDDAARHYTTALGLLRDVAADPADRVELLLGLAAARDRAGDPDATREAYLRAAALARRSSDPAALGEAALGIAALGSRSGTADPVGVGLLEETAELLATGQHDALRSRVLAELSRALRHGGSEPDPQRAVSAADEAVALARAAADPAALAHALLARHDVVWAAGAAAMRLPVLVEMAAAAREAGNDDLVAEAVLLRAGALIEQGDPAGAVELARYTRLADRLGHARGRWGALSRRATLAQLSGQIDEAVAASTEALRLGEAIGLPDRMGVFATLRASLAAIGGELPSLSDLMPAADPLWPAYPLLQAFGHVYGHELDDAARAIRGFSVSAVPEQYDLEFVAIAAVAFAAVGSTAQREWCYDALVPHAGLHVVVGGCAAYHGAVDHHLGMLAAALGRTADARDRLSAAVTLHDRLGAAAWADLSRSALASLAQSNPSSHVFRLVGGMWRLSFEGREVHLPDAKGLRDIATLLAVPDQPVHVHVLLGHEGPATGADPVLDRRAVAEFRARLGELDAEIEDASRCHDAHRAGQARGERDALLSELQAASGLGGRTRRLGDETERARKTVTARIRDTLRRIAKVHPELAEHLSVAVHTGTTCCYAPAERHRWHL
ncbi:ATP-binding protein [Pseudonocardia sp. GCM10023141]|uniref:ATP-binding protein n=1 Tax=Pseudonocardia sp. GCM10023141 TaxID=3252653 RepID=UPI003618BBA8